MVTLAGEYGRLPAPPRLHAVGKVLEKATTIKQDNEEHVVGPGAALKVFQPSSGFPFLVSMHLSGSPPLYEFHRRHLAINSLHRKQQSFYNGYDRNATTSVAPGRM